MKIIWTEGDPDFGPASVDWSTQSNVRFKLCVDFNRHLNLRRKKQFGYDIDRPQISLLIGNVEVCNWPCGYGDDVAAWRFWFDDDQECGQSFLRQAVKEGLFTEVDVVCLKAAVDTLNETLQNWRANFKE